MRLRNIAVALQLCIWFGREACLIGQAPIPVQMPATSPVENSSLYCGGLLSYEKPLRSTLLTFGMSIGAPAQCGSDGSVFFPTYTAARSLDDIQLTVYGVKAESGTIVSVSFSPYAAANLRNIQPGGALAVSDTRVALLVRAVTAEEQMSNKHAERHAFLLLYDRSGTFLHAAPLDLPFRVSATGLFATGEIFVAGDVLADGRQHWAVLDGNGKLLRYLQPGHDDTQYAKDLSREAKLQTAIKNRGMPQIVSYRDHLLLIEMNTSEAIYEIGPGGVLSSTTLKLPAGEKIWQLIPSNGRTWSVITSRPQTERAGTSHLSTSRLKPDRVAEFDPGTGALLRSIDTGPKHYPVSLTCRHDGDFTVLSTDPKDGGLLVEEARLRN